MNFIEYLTEERAKDLYFLYDIDNDKPYTPNGDTYDTWAVSQIKAFYQILHRLDTQEPEKFSRPVIGNKDRFKAMLVDEYKNQLNDEREANPLPELPPIKRREDPQMKLFKDPYNPPD